LKEAGEALFAFTHLPPSRGTSARARNTIERFQEECKRRITTQTVPPSRETAAMLFWPLLASGQINPAPGRRIADHRSADRRPRG
jgi:transposase-like protein